MSSLVNLLSATKKTYRYNGMDYAGATVMSDILGLLDKIENRGLSNYDHSISSISKLVGLISATGQFRYKDDYKEDNNVYLKVSNDALLAFRSDNNLFLCVTSHE